MAAKFLLAKKIKMTQIFDDGGEVHPATLVMALPNDIDMVRTGEKDGYTAVRLKMEKKKKEFRTGDISGYKTGDKIDASVFEEGEKVAVSGVSKGKGFQGVVKRHGFKGGSRTHGQKHSERAPGSIGATWPQRVIKGMRMAGRMGGDRITVKNLKILKIDKENNQFLISGAVPGRRGTLLEIRSTKKLT